jgi:putative ATPase
MSLFESMPAESAAESASRPLADRMRPTTLEDYVGQEHLLGPGKPLRTQIERDLLASMM